MGPDEKGRTLDGAEGPGAVGQTASEEWKQGRSRARSPEGEGGDMRPEETEEDRQAGGQRQSRHGKGRAGCRP